MTDPQNVTKTPLFMCDSYRLIDLDIQFYGMQTPSDLDFWTLYARVIPDWSEEPVEFAMDFDTLEEAQYFADEIERLAG